MLSINPMDVIGVIPARYGSTRFPGKPLVVVAGKALLQWVIEGAQNSLKINKIIVATDDDRIKQLVDQLGVNCVMTDSNLPSGSDRVWAAVENEKCDLVINIQGDEPLITGKLLDQLIAPMLEDPKIEIATLGRKAKLEDLTNPNVAKVVLNKNSEALYFSRHPIPYSRTQPNDCIDGCLKHIGLYAFKKDFLREFCQSKPATIELFEGLEQLRALYLGAKIKVIEVDHESLGVDTPEDISKIEKLLVKG